MSSTDVDRSVHLKFPNMLGWVIALTYTGSLLSGDLELEGDCRLNFQEVREIPSCELIP